MVDKGKWPRKLVAEFSADKRAHLSLTEYQLLRICEKLNLTLEESVPAETRDVRSWGRQALVNYRGNPAHIIFQVSYTSFDEGCPKYFVFVSSPFEVEIRRGMKLWEISTVYTPDLDCALRGFEDRINFVRNEQVPEELLPKENVWVEEQVWGVPFKFAGKVPIFQVTKRYAWRREYQRLEVCREFGDCMESTKIRFNDRRLEHIYEEDVLILDGELQNANQRFSRKSNFTIERLFEDLPPDAEKLPLPEVDQGQMFEIKKLGDLFLELPWQDDFRAIYSWDGRAKP